MFKRIKNTFPFKIKSAELRERQFEKLRLDNGLKVFLISDKNATSCSSALSCEIGSFNDGKYPGTAHFLEHMLFLGVKKYPGHNDYEKFIFDNGGTLNGYTANQHSLYYFNHLNPSYLQGALDRFSRFFYEPLFDPKYVDRERNAVHEEYKKNIESDGWRVLHVQKELADKSHPISQFNTGNLETMTFSREYLMNWFKKSYSGDKMNLVVLGKESLPEMTDMVVESFSPIPSLPPLKQEPVKEIWPDLKGKVVWVESIKDIRELTITWEIPAHFTNLKTKPDILLSGIIGHEGANSILDSLKQLNLAENLSCGTSDLGLGNHTFSISLGLTQKGLDNWKTTCQLIFTALEDLSKQTFPKYLFDDMNDMKKIKYEFQQRNNQIAMDYCEALRKESIESFPLHTMIISEFESTAVNNLVGRLKKNDAFIMISAKKGSPVALDCKEKWMFAKYAVFAFESSGPVPGLEICIPPKNEFVPKQLELIEPNLPTSVPIQLVDSEETQLFFYPDSEFGVPKLYIRFTLKTPLIRPDDARSLVLADLYCRLNPVAYDAEVAGLSYDIFIAENNSIAFSVIGYGEKSILLFEKLVLALKDPHLTNEKFLIFKESLEKRYQNAEKNTPTQQGFQNLYSKIMSRFSEQRELRKACEQLNFETLQEFVHTVFQNRIIQGFVGGNVEKETAKQALKIVEEKLQGRAALKKDIVEAEYVPCVDNRPRAFEYALKVSGNSLILCLDAGLETDQSNCESSFLQKLLQEPFYSELRTKQQTGYIVSSSATRVKKQLLLKFIIQSNQYDSRDLLARTELFIEQYIKEIESQDSVERFEKIRESLIQRLERPFDNLASKMTYYNHIAFEKEKDFGWIDRKLKLLREIEFEKVQAAALRILGRANGRRTAVLGNGVDAENQAFSYQIYKE